MDFNNTTLYDELTDLEKVVIIFTYSAVSLLATGGNACVIYLVVKFQKLKSPTNYLIDLILIANLAVADFFMAVSCIPFSYWPSIILLYWPFDYFMCKFINTVQVITVVSSAYTLVAISLDRFIAVTFPLKVWMKLTKSKVLWSVAVIWIGSFVIAFPLLVVLTTTKDTTTKDTTTKDDDHNVQCVERWSNANESASNYESAYNYSVALMFVQFVIPFFIFIITYTGIGLKLWFSNVPGEESGKLTKNRKDSVIKMIPTMVIITLIFAGSWIPINVLNIWKSVQPSVLEYRHILRVWWGCHMFSVLPSFLNPIVYIVKNRRFRSGFAFILRWVPSIKYSGELHTPQRSRTSFAD